MNIADAKRQIRETVDAYLERDDSGAYAIPPESQRPLFLLGAPGIGKTAIVGQVAHELGIGLVSYSMTHHTRQSALGLPFIVHKSYDGQEFDVSEYTMSEIIASIYDYSERSGHARGILFLDEINCVSETLYPSMLQFLQFKTFGRHRVPDGWVVVCAGNPPEYNKSVYDFDVVTLDRLRKVDVEPDLGAWLDYARATDVHPAIVTYLQVKDDRFYVVEQTPSGKSFVTARGWDDLSRVMKLYEKKGFAIDRPLIAQFIQDEGTAEHFAQYYALFAKYRSDYRVGDILEGAADAALVERAHAARLDERFALVKLVADGLQSGIAFTMRTERTVSIVRDALRGAEEGLEAGGSVHDGLEGAADALAADVARKMQAGESPDEVLEAQRRAATRIREMILACDEERADAGEAAFELMRKAYSRDSAALRQAVEASRQRMANAYAFIEGAFGDGREMAAFNADLSARPEIARFVAKFGSDAYHAHNAAVSEGRSALSARIDALDIEAAAAELARQAARSCGGCSAC